MCVTSGCRRTTVSLPPSAVRCPPPTSMISQRLGVSSLFSARLNDSRVPQRVVAYVHPPRTTKPSNKPEETISGPKPKRKRKPQKPGKTAKMNDRHFVVHNYHDHAEDLDVPEEIEQQPGKRRRGRNSAVSFPLKLHKLLEQLEGDGLGDVISWLPHGRAFLIREPKEFEGTIMPKYFKQTKLTSFQRQLNLYGFQRLTKGHDCGGYYHELFLRGKDFLTKQMFRTKVKGTGFKAASSPDQEPNFYQMKPVRMNQVKSEVVTDSSSYSTEETHQEASPQDYEPLDFRPFEATSPSTIIPMTPISCTSRNLQMPPPPPSFLRKVSEESLEESPDDALLLAAGVLDRTAANAVMNETGSHLVQEGTDELLEFTKYWSNLETHSHSSFEANLRAKDLTDDDQLGEILELLLED